MKILALLLIVPLGLILAGCAGVPISAEACVYSERYGKICATYTDGRWVFRADVQLPDYLLASGSLDDLVKKIQMEEHP